MLNNNNPDTLDVFTKLLNLPDITVTKMSKSADDRAVTFVVKSTRETLPCRQGGKPTRGHGLGRPLRLRLVANFRK